MDQIKTKETITTGFLLPNKQFFTLKEVAELKGINYKTLCNKPYLQPNKGKSQGHLGGRKVFHHATVKEWIELTDEDIASIREA